MNFDFKNKNILIIGGSSGIGLSIVTEFLKSNAKVYSISRNIKKIELAKKYLKKKNIEKHAFFISAEENTIDEFSKILKQFEKNISICFSCAKYSISLLSNRIIFL